MPIICAGKAPAGKAVALESLLPKPPGAAPMTTLAPPKLIASPASGLSLAESINCGDGITIWRTPWLGEGPEALMSAT
jgi:hypothetical protein